MLSRDINFRGCDGVKVTCGAKAPEAFKIFNIAAENKQLDSIGMYNFEIADCNGMNCVQASLAAMCLPDTVYGRISHTWG